MAFKATSVLSRIDASANQFWVHLSKKVDIASCLEKKRDITIRLTANVEVKLYIMKHSKDHQWNCLNYASRDFLLFSKLCRKSCVYVIKTF